MSNSAVPQLDRFFTGTEARYDRWRTLLQQAREWEMSAKQAAAGDPNGARVVKSLEELRQWEDYYAYPGPALLNLLIERATSGDVTGTVRLARTISTAIITHSSNQKSSPDYLLCKGREFAKTRGCTLKYKGNRRSALDFLRVNTHGFERQSSSEPHEIRLSRSSDLANAFRRSHFEASSRQNPRQLPRQQHKENRVATGFTKSALSKLMAEKIEISNKQATAFLDLLAETAVKETKKNGLFVIPGIGRLVKAERKARMGRNPATGEQIKIKAKTVVKFRVAKAAKDVIAPVKKPAAK
jgi:DNA-binding protein HU-beta